MTANVEKFRTGLALEPVSSDPSNPVEGQLQRSDGTHRSKGLWEYRDSAWQQIGSGAGSLDIIYQENFENTAAADLTDGNSSTFLDACAGSLVGSLADETSSPINGDSSLSYTQAASGSTDDFFALPALTVGDKEQENELGITFYYTYSGSDDDIKLIVYDATNGTVLTSDLDTLKTASKATRFSTSFSVPATCTSLRIGFQVAADSSAAKLVVDDIEVSSSPFNYKDLTITSAWTSFTPTFTGFGTVTGVNMRYREVGNVVEIEGSFTTGTTTATEARIDLPNSYTVNNEGSSAELAGTLERDQTSSTGFRDIILSTNGDAYINFGKKVDGSSNNIMTPVNGNEYASSTRHSIKCSVRVNELDDPARHLIVPVKFNFQEWKPYPSVTVQGFGTVTNNNLEYRIVGDDLQIRGDITSGTTAASEFQLPLPNSYTVSQDSGSTVCVGTLERDHSSTTGYRHALLATNGDAFLNLGRKQTGSSENITTPVNGDVIASSERVLINASVKVAELVGRSSSFLAAIPIQPVTLLKDVKASGTDGGEFTSGDWRTRTLNTLTGDDKYVSLSSSQFTIQRGTYLIEWEAPAIRVDTHQTRLRNITDSSTDGQGTILFSGNADTTQNSSTGSAYLTLTSSKTFALEHRCNTTQSGWGFGRAASSFGESVVYAQVKITKLR